MYICRKLIKVTSTSQPNRILIHKPTRIRLIVPEEVVMQPRFTVAILVLQAEGLVSVIRYLGFLFQKAPAGVVAEPQEVAVLIGHFSWDADLVAVEVVDFLFAFAVFVGPIAYLRQGFVGIRIGVEIGIPAVRVDFLQEVAAVPNKSGFLFEAV